MYVWVLFPGQIGILESKAITNNKLIPHDTGVESNPGTLMGGKCSYHCTIPAPLLQAQSTKEHN